MRSPSNGISLLVLSVLILTACIVPSYGQSPTVGDVPNVINEIRSEVDRISPLTGWDSTFTMQMEEAFDRTERNFGGDSLRLIIYGRLLEHYKGIQQSNKSRVKTDFEELLFDWIAPFTAYINDDKAVEKVIRGFPDTYFPTKVLAPELLTESALQIMAEKYPKEVLYALRYMIEPDGLKEAEWAAVNAPYEAKQYFHYHNSVNSLLKRSSDKRIQKLYQIFFEYRYGSNSFYLLHQVFNGTISIEEAHEIGKDREQLYNALIEIYIDDSAIGRFSAEEHLSEISDKYVRKLMFQRYLSSSRLKMEQLEVLSDDARIYFLFRSQNLLKKKDLKNLSILMRRFEMEALGEEDVVWLPDEWIKQFEVRLDEETMPNEFDFLLDRSLWARTRQQISPAYLFGDDTHIMDVGSIDIGGLAEPVFVFHPYISHLSEDEKQIIRLENNPYELLSDLSQVTGKMYSRKIILSLALKHPVEVVAQLAKFQDQPYAVEICRKLVLNAPLTAKNYIVKKDHRIHGYLENSGNIHIEKLYEIDKELGNWTRAYILLDKIVNEELSLQEADEICKNKSELLPHLIELYKKEDYIGHYTVEKELEYAALDFVRKFNISENTDHSYRGELDQLDASTLYTFMIFGEREIISQTFRKMYDRFMTLAGHDLSSFLSSMNHIYIDRFLRMALHYGMESDLLHRLPASDLETVWTAVFRNLEKVGQDEVESEVKKAIEAGEIIIWMQDRSHLRQVHEIIREEYERLVEEQHDEGVAAYGILASIMAQKLREGWSVHAAPFYEIPNLIAMPVYSLFNDQLVNIQHYYFYNDRDGLYSYRNFLRQYERSDYNWKIEDKGLFVKISSRSGKAVEIYANKPTKGEEGIANLESYLKSNNLAPQVIVHRGLSTHTLKTFRKIPASAKLILDGSCGGFHIQSVALENAPGAHILCNRNIGTMHINDPMFKQISESIREGRDIVWPSFWSDMEARLGTNPYFKDYIPPHKNVAALIIKAYYDVLDINN